MSERPRFSVVIPARSPAPALPATLASVAAQDLPALEVLVVDDGLSYDERPSAAGIRLLQGRHAGAGAARNDGARAARGEWIAFLDSDDRWQPGHLAALAEAVSAQPRAAACFAGAVHVCDEGREVARFVPRAPDATLRGLLTRRLQPTTSATAVRREALLRVGGFFEYFSQPAGVEDIDLWWRLAMRWPCTVQSQPLATYVVHLERDRARTVEELAMLTRDRRTCIERTYGQIRGSLARQAAAQHLAIMARYWYVAGFGSRGRRLAAESLLWWPTLNGLTSLGLGSVPKRAREPARALRRAVHRARA